ncbi:GNAT family N-acetyltransferase [Culicoidibacter larvae]|uniref:GNAT family N-acetyltransferase n=1 Tax=Culicoidibacter larvae TaxID=2579976 RepID=A0A5R8Q916_9FIRM|nr:GNAT family N-acetyltransferase [Culicoidibacter larvae]TLG71745.1 GNAT family N-acetyltransferase [Culicoidibacter larvae]
MNITTQRCSVRPFEKSDIKAFMAYRNNMEWMQYQGFKGLSEQQYIEGLLNTQHTLYEGIQLAIIHNELDILIGDFYLKQVGKVMLIGYSISPDMARQGYAYEVVSVMIDQLVRKDIDYIKAGVDKENVASIALLKKLGFEYIGFIEDEDIYILQV